jgi:hypothetical protein
MTDEAYNLALSAAATAAALARGNPDEPLPGDTIAALRALTKDELIILRGRLMGEAVRHVRIIPKRGLAIWHDDAEYHPTAGSNAAYERVAVVSHPRPSRLWKSGFKTFSQLRLVPPR